MRELVVSGWLVKGDYGVPCCKRVVRGLKRTTSIPDEVHGFAETRWFEEEPDLGAQKAVIPNASVRIYVTNDECTLEEAQTALVAHLDGVVGLDLRYEGYSEFTIMGLSVNEFCIGGHDLTSVLLSYEGKFVHFVLECQ